jgi:hypothetical protein
VGYLGIVGYVSRYLQLNLQRIAALCHLEPPNHVASQEVKTRDDVIILAQVAQVARASRLSRG